MFAELLKKIIFSKSKNTVRIKTSSSFVRDKWIEIENLVQTKNPSSLKQSVIIADKILEQVIKDATGASTMGTGLKMSKNLFSDYAIYDKAWKAHKVRNSMVHDPSYDPPHYVLTDAIEQFKVVFKDLKLL